MKGLKVLLKVTLVLALVVVGMAQTPVEASSECKPWYWWNCEDCSAEVCMSDPGAYCRCVGHSCDDIIPCDECQFF